MDVTELEIARTAHEVNRAYCAALGDFSQPPWHDAPAWQQDSAINGVRFHVDNRDAGPSASHKNWLAEKEADGWIYGEIKDADAKTHPCMVPFTELPVEQQAKDFIFRSIVHVMTLDRGTPITTGSSQTVGEYRVGVDFNPSGSGFVRHIKSAATNLIDLIDRIPCPAPASTNEIARLKALAMTDIEEGAMWAVKAATKPEPGK